MSTTKLSLAFKSTLQSNTENCTVQLVLFHALNHTVLYCGALHYTACTGWHCFALHGTELHCTALHCTSLH